MYKRSIQRLFFSKAKKDRSLVDCVSFEIMEAQELTHAFLVTDSEEAFQEMTGQLNIPNVIQLYRDYLENFVINKEGKAS